MLPSDVLFHERGWLSSNCVVLKSHDSACVIDTGYYSHAEQTSALVNSALGNDLRLEHVLNTHLHSDHCGGNALLSQQHPDALIWVPEPYAPSVQAWDTNALSHEPTGQVCPSFSHDRVLVPNSIFSFANRSWQIIHAPGHDDWAIMLFCPDDSILISGDALWGNGFGVVFPAIYSSSGFDRVASTLDLIDVLNPKTVIPGHGSVFSDVPEAMDRARSRLSYFLRSPLAHAQYAAKVLIKFKLLEWQHINFHSFLSWCKSNDYLNQLHRSHFQTQAFLSWIHQLLESLEESGACEIKNKILINK